MPWPFLRRQEEEAEAEDFDDTEEDEVIHSDTGNTDDLDGAPGCWESDPPPPEDMWADAEDAQYLDKVSCKADLRVIEVKPQNGSFELRAHFRWLFRTPSSGDRTEPRIRVPGIRCPGLIVKVEESRVWRDIEGDTEVTMRWLGTSVFRISGFKVFDLHDFPFDRQVINLGPLDLVWRRDEDTNNFEESMRVVRFKAQTLSMVQAWKTFDARIVPLNIITPLGTGESDESDWPTYCTQFTLRLRLQRRHEYYISEVFFVSCVILFNSLWALGMSPSEDHASDRLALFAGGMLTLITFKYGVAAHMPHVAYQTWLDWFLSMQIYTLIFASATAVFLLKFVAPYEHSDPEPLTTDSDCDADHMPVVVRRDEDGSLEEIFTCHADAFIAYKARSFYIETVDHIEDAVMLLLMLVWAGVFLYAMRCKKSKRWTEIQKRTDLSSASTFLAVPK